MPQVLFRSFLESYPELLAALALALFLAVKSAFGKNRDNAGPIYIPVYLVSPAAEILKFFPNYLQGLQLKLNYCGLRGNTQLGVLAAAKVYPALLTPLAGMFINHPLILTALAAFLFFAPDLVLTILARRRQASIRESLPELLDLMVLCVDAGLGLDATLSRVAQDPASGNSALLDELLTLNRDILLGMSRERAFQELYKRTGVEELGAFAGSLNQTSQLGLSISKTLRNQAEFLRSKLSQKAEEKAARLPIYMAFPLWFCIMPALMVLVLAPSLLIFFEQVKPGFGL